MATITILNETCKGVDDCFICLFVCPKELFESSGNINAQGYVPPRIKDVSQCTGCGNCMISCPDMAIVVQRDKEANYG
jgi:2-oxoglutarate ferredoxin oxidoreductase subunit delta